MLDLSPEKRFCYRVTEKPNNALREETIHMSSVHDYYRPIMMEALLASIVLLPLTVAAAPSGGPVPTPIAVEDTAGSPTGGSPLQAAPAVEHLAATDISRLRTDETHQLTTFRLKERSKTIPVKRGQRVTIGETTGSGCITQFWMTFPGWFWAAWEADKPVSQTILKTLILRIYFDGASEPAVEAPVGDFFGNGLCEISNFTSRYFGMSSGGFFCKFPMPFRKGFRIELENRDNVIDTDVFCNVLYQLRPVAADEGYFHAQFHTGRNQGPEPIRILDAVGQGHYVGCVLSAQGQNRNYLSFLEAPEYVYVDDNTTSPRIVGTGLEDYFLGGWYFREGTFTGQFHGLPSKDPLNASVAMYRVHDADAISFKHSLRFEFVNPWEPDRLQPFAWSAVAFYYLNSPSATNPPMPTTSDLLCWYRIKNTDHQSIP